MCVFGIYNNFKSHIIKVQIKDERKKKMSWISERKEERLFACDGKELDERTYNLFLGGIVLYGLLMNILMFFIFGDVALAINPLVFIIGYFVCALTGIFMSSKSKNPLISFIGYNLVVIPVGLVVNIAVTTYVEEGDANLVFQAIVLTAVTTAVMIGLSIAFPQFFSKLGGILLGSLIGLIIAEILSLFLFPWAQNIFAWIGAIIFALYIGYDYWRAQEYPKTLDNAVDSAVDIYLDIINLFLRILQILGNSKSSSRRK